MAPTHLDRWKLAPNYLGETWDGYYIAIGQHRDSDTITRSNWAVTIAAIPETGAYDEDTHEGGVIVVREGHWAVGWIEFLAIHESCVDALTIADDFAKRLENYPILDEDHHSQLEQDEVDTYWRGMSVSERLEYLQHSELSIFAARRNYLPDDPNGRLFELLRGV